MKMEKSEKEAVRRGSDGVLSRRPAPLLEHARGRCYLRHPALRQLRLGRAPGAESLRRGAARCAPNAQAEYVKAGCFPYEISQNCEPHKTSEVRWFPLGALPPNLTMTARNPISAHKQPSASLFA